jgi:hypothetical protein
LRIPHAVGIPQGSRTVSPHRHHALKLSKYRCAESPQLGGGLAVGPGGAEDSGKCSGPL